MNFNTPLVKVNARKAFTLIEILIVIGLLVLLFGLTTQMMGGVSESQGRARARTDMELMASALEAFAGKYGGYPRLSCANNEKFNAGEVFKCLVGRMALRLQNGQVVMAELGVPTKPFLDPSKIKICDPSDEFMTDVDPEKNGVYFADFWNEPYLYFYDTSNAQGSLSGTWRSTSFILLSKGPDRKESDVFSMYSTGIIPDYVDYTSKKENLDNIIQGRDN